MLTQMSGALAMNEYLDALVARLSAALGEKLLGVYLTGSHAVGAGDGACSDIDILVVVRSETDASERAALMKSLDHTALPVPGAGLELVVVTEATARAPTPPVHFDWAIDTGRGSETAAQNGAVYDEFALDLEIARTQARALLGPPAQTLIAEVPRALIFQMLIASLEWHIPMIGDPFHDPGGQNAVLNAGRAMLYAGTGRLGTKAQGGALLAKDVRWQALAQGALSLRAGTRHDALDPVSVAQLLHHAIEGVARAKEML